MKKNTFLNIVLLVMIFIVFLCIDNGILWFVYPSRIHFPIIGIDVSHHQGEINWPKMVRNKQIEFIIVKATEGGDFIDPDYRKNIANAQFHMFITGAYHFFTLKTPGMEQAKNFISMVKAEDIDLPPFIDLEFGGNSRYRPEIEELENEIDNFITLVRDFYHKEPIIYTTPNFYNVYIKHFKDKGKLRFWIRNIYFQPGKIAGNQWLFWQYHSKAHISGIKGAVDLNVFYGNKREFYSGMIDSSFSN